MSLARKLGALLSSGLIDPSVGGTPAGAVLPFSGSTAPDGWLLCYGQAVSRATYATLFAAIGTAYGTGDGSTTFNLPDLRGRVPGGRDNMGGTAASRLTTAGSGVDGVTLGAAGGAETHTLTAAQLAAHTHTGSAATGGSHSHTATAASGSSQNGLSSYTGGQNGTTASASITTSTHAGHTHSVTVNANTGGDSAHNNTQPTIVLSYIIKT